MSNYQTVNLPRELAERIAKVCMFTMFAQDAQELRAILAKPSGEPAAWFDPVHNDFLTAAGRATTISMGDGDRLARYTVPLYAAPTAAEELDSVRHWRGKHDVAVRELAAVRQHKNDYMQAAEETRAALMADIEDLRRDARNDASAYKDAIEKQEEIRTELTTWKRRAIEAESKLRTYDPQVVELGGQAMQALLADPRPSELVLSKCKLCDQLQADLTKLDEKLDQTQDLLRYMVYDYRSVVQAGYDRITALGSDCDSVAKMLDDNPNYQKALALLLPDLESRPEERGTPETEPCSGCGTPGYTGNCDKCVPY